MLNFEEDRFLGVQSGAVGLAGAIADAIGSLVGSGNACNVHFLGTGGAAILMQPAVQLLRERSALPVFDGYTAELIEGNSRNLGPGSIVVLPSLSGTTKESVEFLKFAKRRGAKVITLVGDTATPLGQGGDHVFTNPAADDTSSESFYIQSLLIALSILKHRGEIENHTQLVEELQIVPQALLEIKKALEPHANSYARAIAGHDYHIVTGAGNVWPEAFYFGMCILEEMQWIRTRPVHASDFFHGTLELVEDGVSVLLLKGEDYARPLAERVETFVPSVGGDLTVLDTANYPTEGISPELRALLSPAIVATILERVSAHLEVMRDHPLSTRRYYRRVDY
jgi:fructoselysine-6-phosphate deglycase